MSFNGMAGFDVLPFCEQEFAMGQIFKRVGTLAVGSLAAVLATSPAGAQTAASKPGMVMPAQPGATSPAPGSLTAAMEKTSKDMAAVPMTGDADRDFIAMMMPHHQGAIDMARDELAHGKDPVALKMARGIVIAQEREIVEMKAWQAKHAAMR